MLPEEFTTIKKKIEQSNILTPQEKREWLFLLPKMKPEQMKELDRILSIRMPPFAKAEVRFQPHSLKAEVRFQPEAKGARNDRRKEGLLSSIRHSISEIRHHKLPLPPKPTMTPLTSPLSSLRSLTIDNMRKPPSVYTFLEEVAASIKKLIEEKKAIPDEVRRAFEASPLYASYLKSGLKIMAGERTEELSRSEFEAITDFRAALPRILRG